MPNLAETVVNQLVFNPTNCFKQDNYPHFIKYMGSKSKIMDFVTDGVNEVYNGGAVCDLFAGSGSLLGALGRQVPMVSNDIQAYSGTIADVYLNGWLESGVPSVEEIVGAAEKIVRQRAAKYPIAYDYFQGIDRESFVAIEKTHQSFIDISFDNDWHLFTKNYSGTWWSAEQCAWIDALREVAEQYKHTQSFNLILSCLMHSLMVHWP